MSVIALGADTSLTPPSTVILWNQLQGNPQALYNVCSVGEDGTLHVSDDVVNLTQVNSRFTFGVGQDHSWEIKVKSSEELERLRSNLMSKPILFRASVEQARSDFYVVFAIHKNWIAELAVLVDTRHPSIREVLSSKLNEATQSMRNGKKFCLKVQKNYTYKVFCITLRFQPKHEGIVLYWFECMCVSLLIIQFCKNPNSSKRNSYEKDYFSKNFSYIAFK
ncbi:uncharacterized protein LOC134241246 [Saccostrea cucullata]|uniref:uncharacterized protein LOC134241246 n=1 Tax=Saccostrea cuccullata TaxID=36930 RepID=UPI002ED2372D